VVDPQETFVVSVIYSSYQLGVAIRLYNSTATGRPKKEPPLSAASGVDIAKLETWIEEKPAGQKRLPGVG
jgi:hypothetical protein